MIVSELLGRACRWRLEVRLDEGEELGGAAGDAAVDEEAEGDDAFGAEVAVLVADFLVHDQLGLGHFADFCAGYYGVSGVKGVLELDFDVHDGED